jgi:hypothetical protein
VTIPDRLRSSVPFTPRLDPSRLAQALACVYGLPDELAAQASAPDARLRWDERASLLRCVDSRGQLQEHSTEQGHFEPSGAWEALVASELLPPSWLDDEHRTFLTRGFLRAKLGPSLSPVWLRHPHTRRACVLFAAAIESFVTAESLAELVHSALAPWRDGVLEFMGCRWVCDAAEIGGAERTEFVGATSDRAYERAVDAVAAVMGPAPDLRDRDVHHLPWCEQASRAWRAAQAAGVKFAAKHGPPGARGRAFADLPDPFEPLADILTLGFCVWPVQPRPELFFVEP